MKSTVSDRDGKPLRKTPNNVYVRRHCDQKRMVDFLMEIEYLENAEKLKSLDKTCEVLPKICWDYLSEVVIRRKGLHHKWRVPATWRKENGLESHFKKLADILIALSHFTSQKRTMMHKLILTSLGYIKVSFPELYIRKLEIIQFFLWVCLCHHWWNFMLRILFFKIFGLYYELSVNYTLLIVSFNDTRFERIVWTKL